LSFLKGSGYQVTTLPSGDASGAHLLLVKPRISLLIKIQSKAEPYTFNQAKTMATLFSKHGVTQGLIIFSEPSFSIFQSNEAQSINIYLLKENQLADHIYALNRQY
jgi:hypothetical protein